MQNYIFQIDKLETYNNSGYILKDISLNLEPGIIHALVGGNGAWKNTLVSILAGFNSHFRGEIYFKGRVITDRLSVSNIEGVDFLLPKFMLADNFTVAENLYLLKHTKKHPLIPNVNKKKMLSEAEKLFSQLELNIDFRKKVYELSNEQKKIIDLVKIYLKSPDVVIMQEPTDNLSTNYIQMFYKLVNLIKNDKGCFLYVTSQWEEALRIAEKISVLSNGKLVGTMLNKEAKKNPRKILQMISGDRYDDNNSNIEMLSRIFNTAKFLTSNYELKNVLKMLARYATEGMHAEACSIYLVSENTSTIMDTVEYKNKKTIVSQLTKEAVISIIKERDIFYSTKNEKKFASFFKKNENVNTIICLPVFIRSDISSVIHVSYESFYVHSQKESMFLSTLAREVAIAIEKTRLMGRSTLLQESHHRIKNNLQTIISLLSLQKEYIQKDKHKSVEEIIEDVITRIKSIASVHDLLSRDKLGRSIINFKDIVQEVLKIYDDRRVNINLLLEDIFIPYNKATTIALIINELVHNSYKHAFIDRNYGKINIMCKSEDDYINLIVEDDGIGLPDGFNMDNLSSLGLSIIRSIVTKELKGDMAINNNNGTKITIALPVYNISLTRG